MSAVSAYLLAGHPYGPVQLCMVIAMFEVARQRPLRISVVACGVAAVIASATLLINLTADVDSPALLALAWTAWIVLPWSLGALVHVLSAARARARRELVARAAWEERLRLAGEVHDIAGHGFSVVAMQAGVALLTFDEQPEQARRSLEAIKTTSDKSLSELRGMLETFHPGNHGDRSGVAPESVDGGLADLDELIDQVRLGGVAVELDMTTVDSQLSGAVDSVAFRVVQESLTNVLRHAGPARADVRIIQHDDELVVLVVDDGQGVREGHARQGRG